VILGREGYKKNAQIVRDCWINHRTKLLLLAVALMLAASFIRLENEFYRLTLHKGLKAAIDLRYRYWEVKFWFAGEPVYYQLSHAVYPPATHVILWPLVGWLTFEEVRWLWAITSVFMLGWLVYILVKESLAKTKMEQAFIALLPLSMYATGIAIGNGQLILHILPVLLTGLFWIKRGGKWHQDLLGSFLIAIALVSPSITAPFFWIVLFVPGRIRAALLVVLIYLTFTLIASWFQDGSTLSLIERWISIGQAGSAWGAVSGGYSNLHSWVALFGTDEFLRFNINKWVSLIALGGLGIWVYLHRRVDIWLLIGVSAIMARIWTYHRWYDDLLIILPMITLFRIAKRGPYPNVSDVLAAGLLVMAWCSVLAPIRLLVTPPWDGLIMTGQATVWGLMLIFLLYQARLETTRASLNLAYARLQPNIKSK
jgi:hypothetical protein